MRRKTTTRLLILVLLAGWAAFTWWQERPAGDGVATPTASATASGGDRTLQVAFENRQSDLQVEGAGRVIRVLSDDNEGSRHQRFIVELGSGQTLLIAHNIDLAPRVANLRRGDRVAFFGEYEWTDQGGTIHWTHHDPNGRHPGGWIEHKGQKYD